MGSSPFVFILIKSSGGEVSEEARNCLGLALDLDPGNETYQDLLESLDE
jgi:hypothetical protein